MPKNWEARDKKLKKRREGMKVNSRGLLTVILPVIVKKGKEAEARQHARPDKPA